MKTSNCVVVLATFSIAGTTLAIPVPSLDVVDRFTAIGKRTIAPVNRQIDTDEAKLAQDRVKLGQSQVEADELRLSQDLKKNKHKGCFNVQIDADRTKLANDRVLLGQAQVAADELKLSQDRKAAAKDREAKARAEKNRQSAAVKAPKPTKTQQPVITKVTAAVMPNKPRSLSEYELEDLD